MAGYDRGAGRPRLGNGLGIDPRYRLLPVLGAVASLGGAVPVLADGWDPNTRYSNTDSIVNTRHNLAAPFDLPSGGFLMEGNFNNYEQVCVYCHTPHGANDTIDAPLWNRTNAGNSYTLYDMPLQSGQTPTQPGVSSLTCLSCHDGTVAVDSIVNMPGSGRYDAAQKTGQNEAFLDTWPGGTDHMALAAGGGPGSCLACHGRDGFVPELPFDVFAIGTDLTDDHPVGVQLPDGAVYDFNTPTGVSGNLRFFDGDGDGRADSDEVRFYDTGDGYEVECASCHDPHGVTTTGAQTGPLVPSFLRISNSQSNLCLTCHDK